jgi:DNA-binding NarL/FixJ family response regulator
VAAATGTDHSSLKIMSASGPTRERAGIAVSLVEDNRGMRESFTALLNQAPGLRCVSSYATGEDAVIGIPQDQPDVALVDIHLPGMNGIECVARLKQLLPALEILMLTRYEKSDTIFASLRAGASGYLVKDTPSVELIQAVEQVHAGGAPLSMQVASKVVTYFQQIKKPSSDLERLTPREQELLESLAKGYSYRELADTLGISINTARAHLHAIYRKLHVNSGTQAVVKYFGR